MKSWLLYVASIFVEIAMEMVDHLAVRLHRLQQRLELNAHYPHAGARLVVIDGKRYILLDNSSVMYPVD